MAYVRPLVMVFQEYAKMSVATETTTLNPCAVGPCYHIIDSIEDDELAYTVPFEAAGLSDVSFPSLKPGAQIVEEKVDFYIKDPVIELAATPYVSDGMSEATISFVDINAYPVDVVLGDLVKVTDTDNADAVLGEGMSVVGFNATTFEVTVSRSITTTSTNLKVTITREVEAITLAYDATEVTIDITENTFDISALTVSVNASPRTVVEGKVYVGYHALRNDLLRVLTLAGSDEITNELGKICSDNPLALAASIISANTTTSVKVVGVQTDNIAGYTAAQDLLESAEDIYAIVPLSQEAAIISIFKSHAEQMSLPEIGKWRVCIGSTALTVEKTLSEGTAGTVREDASTNPVLLEDDTADFLADGVIPGDTLQLTSGGTVATYIIDEVIAGNLLKTTEDISATFTVGVAYTYEVIRSLDKSEQATEIENTSRAFGSQRFVHVWPDVCEIDNVEEPGYYLACAVAGMTAGLPSHQGFTRISIAGIGDLKHSNGYFNQTQLDTIANGGTFIFMQLSENAPPYVRHQLTTEMSTIEFREFSFVKNFDYVSYICKDVLDRYLGKYNINSSTIAILETAIRSVLDSLKLYNLPKIGSPVINYTIVSIEQLDDTRDRVEAIVNIYFPYALNTIGLHLVSQ